ncbi:hypothetical protein ACJX0J_010683, partial [Zea mays]
VAELLPIPSATEGDGAGAEIHSSDEDAVELAKELEDNMPTSKGMHFGVDDSDDVEIYGDDEFIELFDYAALINVASAPKEMTDEENKIYRKYMRLVHRLGTSVITGVVDGVKKVLNAVKKYYSNPVALVENHHLASNSLLLIVFSLMIMISPFIWIPQCQSDAAYGVNFMLMYLYTLHWTPKIQAVTGWQAHHLLAKSFVSANIVFLDVSLQEENTNSLKGTKLALSWGALPKACLLLNREALFKLIDFSAIFELVIISVLTHLRRAIEEPPNETYIWDHFSSYLFIHFNMYNFYTYFYKSGIASLLPDKCIRVIENRKGCITKPRTEYLSERHIATQ